MRNRKIGSERGAALVISIFVLLLLMGFVALAVTRTSNETIITSNDVEESHAYAASEAALDSTTRDLADVFESKLTPSSTDISTVQAKAVPGFPNYTFTKSIVKTKAAEPIIMTGGSFGGLYALRDAWQIETTALDNTSSVTVGTKRRFFSDKIPIFQFGVFYEDDLELNRPPLFTLGGRVHSNGNFFVSSADGYGIYLSSKVTAAKEIVNDIWKTKTALTVGYDDQGQVFINNDSGIPKELLTGQASVKCKNPSGPNVFASRPELPYCSKNSSWSTQKQKFQGNLEANVTPMNLPLKKINVDLIEILRRGKNIGDLAKVGGTVAAVDASTADTDTLSRERFANKPGIRVSLADSQQKLPGCAAVSAGTYCGVRLDGSLGANSIGYQPKPMADGYVSTALNATRMAFNGREVWIKVETVEFPATSATPITHDITEDILSTGVTHRAPVGGNFQIENYTSTQDSRSIINLQQFALKGSSIPNTGSNSYVTYADISSTRYTFAIRYNNADNSCYNNTPITCSDYDEFAQPFPSSRASSNATAAKEDARHLYKARINSSSYKYAIAPFPIMMFDTREGLPNDSLSSANSDFGSGYVPASGVMSMVDIDIANLRSFLNGNWDGKFPTDTPFALNNSNVGLRSTDVPEQRGWVLYISDRRGDYDFDGEYDMEDVFPNGTLQYNEDVNGNGILDVDYTNEATSYSNSIARGRAATADHWYYRRGVRLVNGTTLPGVYDTSGLGNTKGFTVSSENGVYVWGNYNATSASYGSGTSVTPPESYYPQNTSTHIPASIVSDAVSILSNAWSDANSFNNPFDRSQRDASNTVVRFGMIAGDAITGNVDLPYNPSGFGQLNGGLHNFKRFLEDWNGKRLNYSGSLINLTNSRNNNGFWTCCDTVYRPPTRDWTFDTTFLNADRLPPGTPFIYTLSFTGFQRKND
ncbi:MAG: hypothetical protein R2684_16150 [Pyrinomonadaceae bacterium]